MVLKSPEGWFWDLQFTIHNSQLFLGGVDFEILLRSAVSIKSLIKKK